MAVVPCAIVEVILEGRECALLPTRRQSSPDGLGAPNRGIEQRLWAPVIGLGETVATVGRNRDDLDSCVAKNLGDGIDRWKPSTVVCGRLAKVVREQPVARLDHRVEGENHDGAACNAAKLHQSLRGVLPVVNREDRHRGVDRAIVERQGFGSACDGRR
jgi:hypothetical protein